jgi:hypothetical protein
MLDRGNVSVFTPDKQGDAVAVTKYTKKAKNATQKVVSQQIDRWTDDDRSDVLQCRSVWHAWELYTVLDNGKEYAEILRCSRGHGYKYRILNSRTGAIIRKWTPLLDKEYYMPAGAGRISQANMNMVRLAAIHSFQTTEAAGPIHTLIHAAIAEDGHA